MDQAISFKQVNYFYESDSNTKQPALSNINLTIDRGDFVAIVGHTGSGKSTLVQHINALLKPASGTIDVCDYQITPQTTNKNLKQLRQHVGMVFQFPEKQLFEETVLKDVMFGPLNYGMTAEEAQNSAITALNLVNLNDEIWDKSPFDLSGGQMRRVAIAGVLAMKPEVLILDEPTAGLDPRSHTEIMTLAKKLQVEYGMTIILVTHQMDDVVDYAQQVVVMEKGVIVKQGTPKEIFADPEWVLSKQLTMPTSAMFVQQLADNGVQLEDNYLQLDDLAKGIKEFVMRGELDE